MDNKKLKYKKPITKKLWKILALTKTGRIMSFNGNCEWGIDKWKKHEGKIEICEAGFHASILLKDAIEYGDMYAKNYEERIKQPNEWGKRYEQYYDLPLSILAVVEVCGKYEDDNECTPICL